MMQEKKWQKGEFNLLIIPLVLVGLLLIVAVLFAVNSNNQANKYKTQTDKIVANNVKKAVLAQQKTDAKLYLEKAKQPFAVYKGAAYLGSIQVSYPKTWSLYVDQTSSSSSPLNGYGYPGQVPSINNNDNKFALRFQMVGQSYNQVVNSFNGYIREGKVTVKAFAFKQVPQVVGVRVDGEIIQGKQGSMIIVPLRDKTLKVWTESSQFEPDFNKNILPNFRFTP